ncbi:hypothetical protein OG705_16460 [Streptomyces sp. NBC_00838]|uniref:hypothetical protein n=1 Tax=Streptomyces sp. NBC_00838 TaxID=2903680 RepID=UPI003866DB35|nr:hypothetical protein OG705_16460 [Streptomyces sp. NBC_00838]
MTQGAGQVRNMWPDILEAVKNRRRFTWILLSQNAQVAGFDGTTLQLGFPNAGARDNFASSGSEEVLKQVLAEQFHVQWKIEAIIDPSGGTPQPPAPGGGNNPGGGGGYGGGAGGGYGGGGGFGGGDGGTGPQAPAPSQRPAPPAQSASSGAGAGSAMSGAYAPAAPAHTVPGPTPPEQRRPADTAPPAPRHVAPEDDTPEEDDADLVDSALSGHDLIVRELGATVVEEYPND